MSTAVLQVEQGRRDGETKKGKALVCLAHSAELRSASGLLHMKTAKDHKLLVHT